MQEHSNNNHHVSKLVVKWKIHFIAITIAAIIVAVFLSEWFIQPKYRSFAIVYPSNIVSYGSESALQQMLQVFESTEVKNAAIGKMNIAAHYGIDTSGKQGAEKVICAYESNVDIAQTSLGAVKIKVVDADPKFASDMVNAIIYAFNLKVQTLHKNKTLEQIAIIKNELLIKKHQVDSLNAILEELRVKYLIFDYDMQSQEVTRIYLNAVSSGRTAANLKDVDVLMRNLEEKGGEYNEVKKMFDAELKSYVDAQAQYDNAIKELTKELNYTTIITYPSPSYNKAYPVCWQLILVSVIFANLFLFVIILIMDNRKKRINISES